MQHVLSILVENKPGVLARVAAMFNARGYNIDSLSVAETLDPTTSRITCMTSGSEQVVEQIVKQLRKLIDVLRVVQFPMGSAGFVAREMVLVKVQARDHKRGEVLRIAEIFKANVVDISKEHIVLEATGDQAKTNAFLELLAPLGIHEIARTGPVALSRGRVRLSLTAANPGKRERKSTGGADRHALAEKTEAPPRSKVREDGTFE